jgi:hypothetical protein
MGGGTGHLNLDAGPVDLTCLTDGGLSATEQMIVSMPADSWLSLPNTAFGTFCGAHEDPSVHAVEGCDAVINDWSGGIFDDGDRLMILWGGGHGGYYGNEVYGFSLATASWRILRAATPLDAGQAPSEPMYDGTPVSRHTYDGLVYLPDARAMFAFGGASAPNGYSVNTAWSFDFASASWTQLGPTFPSSAGHYHMGSAYDPVTQHIFVRDEMGIWDYDLAADSWSHRVDYGYAPYYPTYTTYAYRRGLVLPAQRLFLAMGDTLTGGAPDIVAFDIDAGVDVTSSFTWSGDVSAVSRGGTGLDFDPRANAIVAWSGGAPGVMDVASHQWAAGSATGAPAQQVGNGTYGRFRYVAYLNAFILVNNPGDDVYLYKLTAGCGP